MNPVSTFSKRFGTYLVERKQPRSLLTINTWYDTPINGTTVRLTIFWTRQCFIVVSVKQGLGPNLCVVSWSQRDETLGHFSNYLECSLALSRLPLIQDVTRSDKIYLKN